MLRRKRPSEQMTICIIDRTLIVGRISNSVHNAVAICTSANIKSSRIFMRKLLTAASARSCEKVIKQKGNLRRRKSKRKGSNANASKLVSCLLEGCGQNAEPMNTS